MRFPDRQLLMRQTDQFLRTATIAAVVLLAAHLVPKGYAPRSTWRLLWTLAFFASTGTLCWMIAIPREEWLRSYFAWRFEHAPQAIDRMWRKYLYSLDIVCRVLGLAALALTTATALLVLSAWFRGFSGMLGLVNMAWYTAAAVLLLFPVWGGFLLTELIQRRRKLAEQLGITHWYQPRPWTALWRESDEEATDDPVSVLEDGAFRVGGTAWRWSDLTKSCLILGQPGSGKTLCVLNAILDAILRGSPQDTLPVGGLILDPKGDFQDKIVRLARRLGRERDLRIIDPAQVTTTLHWNPLDSTDDELELASRFTATMEALGTKQDDNSFWMDAARKFLRHAISLVRLTNPTGEPPCFRDIALLATSLDAIVERTDRLDPADPRGDACLTFFANEWTVLADSTRTSVLAHITNMIDPFLMEPYATIFAGKSTERIDEMIGGGRILYVHMPVADKELMSKVIGTFIKLEYFRQILRSPNKDHRTFFLCDEFQVYFTSAQGKGDADFFERSRQSNHANIVAVQNLPALCKLTRNADIIHNFLANCAVKLFLRNSDAATNAYASQLFGNQLVASSTTQGAAGRLGLVKDVGMSEGTSDTSVPMVPAETFLELIIPSPDERIGYCEAIVHRGSRAILNQQEIRQRWRAHPL